MTDDSFKLHERAITLYCTGKYASKAAATIEAKAQLAREEQKRKPKPKPVSSDTIMVTLPDYLVFHPLHP